MTHEYTRLFWHFSAQTGLESFSAVVDTDHFKSIFKIISTLCQCKSQGKLKYRTGDDGEPSGTEEWAIAGWATQAIKQVQCHNRRGKKEIPPASQQSRRAHSHGCHILWTAKEQNEMTGSHLLFRQKGHQQTKFCVCSYSCRRALLDKRTGRANLVQQTSGMQCEPEGLRGREETKQVCDKLSYNSFLAANSLVCFLFVKVNRINTS